MKIKKIKAETIIRTIVLALALINQALAIFGKEALPITEDEVYQVYQLGRKVMSNLDSILKSRDITLPTKVHLVKAMVFLWSCMDVRVGL